MEAYLFACVYASVETKGDTKCLAFLLALGGRDVCGGRRGDPVKSFR